MEFEAVVLDDQGSQDEHANGGQVAAVPLRLIVLPRRSGQF
jgi:hypothetical protein